MDMTEDTAKDFRVAIVGGGICGIVCAIALQRAGIRVDIFEAASRYGEVGAGIGIGPNAVRVLQKLSLLDDLTAFSREDPPAVRPFKYKFGAGEGDVLFQSPVREGELSLGMHRASFLEALVKSIDPEVTLTHFNKRCTSVLESPSDPSRVVLHFSDSTTHETDLVLGCDGIKSTVRDSVVEGSPGSKGLVFTNSVAYRGLASMDKLKDAGVNVKNANEMSTVYMGDSRHLVVYPIRNNTILNVAAVVTDFSVPMGHKSLDLEQPWVSSITREEFADQFKGWNNDVMTILACVEHPTRWYMHGLYPPPESYVKGRVALIGDAAHAMLPFLAAGAGQGIEDAYVMGRLLAHPRTNASNIEDVLRAYDRIRAPRANDISLQSRRCGEIYEGYGPLAPEDRLACLEGMWEKVWRHNLEADIEAAFQSLWGQKA